MFWENHIEIFSYNAYIQVVFNDIYVFCCMNVMCFIFYFIDILLLSVYFMTAKVTKTRYTLAGALFATFVGAIASVLLVGVR